VKIRLDFVSNSSSTSFIYIGAGKLSKSAFFTAIGVETDSPLSELFDRLYQSFCAAIDSGSTIIYEHELDQEGEYPDFSKEAIERAKLALKEGKTVVVGGFSSDGDVAESFLCTDAFEIEGTDFFLSGLDNYW